ncbi:hypothetical protein ACFFOM_12720 [Microlunatus capsulatus]|uniref:Uncharacterized protein n=1 Tax=Microlunatus capsulatus TaxID=99117 RepID=A0ABS4Z8L5_9ACTN|nr:hypothetical protein [Microlunatus capsulatus]MBP2417393.1 hypothetical protein [Microlunatus capsulatus]
MDITQLVITLGSVVGVALVGAMAVVPSVMDARAGTADAPVAPTPLAPRPRRSGHPHAARRPAHRGHGPRGHGRPPVDLAA